MPLSFAELIRKAREASRFAHSNDLARLFGMRKEVYYRIETGGYLPSWSRLQEFFATGVFPEATCQELTVVWRKEKARQAGIPTPANDLDVEATLYQMSRELAFILRKHAPEVSGVHATIVQTFKKRAEIILRTGLET